jgi:phosphopantothenate-cysteine ligase/phosphopantothenoylcysteine decarboxylase/phosphopantothenate--cysteine ligase
VPYDHSSRILVTAGSTVVPIDKVRVIDNIFRGRTGEAIAAYAAAYGNSVTLLSSARAREFTGAADLPNVTRRSFRTFDDLAALMEREVCVGGYDAIIHSAAVSDYVVAGVLVPGLGGLQRLALSGSAAAKISSSHDKLYLELKAAPKLVDKVRKEWGFTGMLVKFKLQVDMPDEELLEIARKSREASDADFIVANCLEWSREYAYIVGGDGEPSKVSREELPAALLRRIA